MTINLALEPAIRVQGILARTLIPPLTQAEILFIPASQPFDGLTAREQQLAQLLALGFSNNQIAGQLGNVASALEALHTLD